LLREKAQGLPFAILEQRQEVCCSCEKFNKDRCSHIELGCRSAFVRYIATPGKACPLGYWAAHQLSS
jgi:hypothetical protein